MDCLMRFYKTSKLDRSLWRHHFLCTNRMKRQDGPAHVVFYPVRGFPQQDQGPFVLGSLVPEPHCASAFSLNQLFLALAGQPSVYLLKSRGGSEPRGWGRCWVMVLTLFSESLLLFYGSGFVTELDLLAHSSHHGKFSYKTLLSIQK